MIVGGGLVLGALAAPAIFRTVRSRAEAGTVFAAILERYDGAAILSLALVLVTSFLRAGITDEDLRDGRILVRWALLAVLALATLYSSGWASPVARSIRRATPAFDDLPEGDLRRYEFRVLHERSRRAMSVAVLAGAATLFLS